MKKFIISSIAAMVVFAGAYASAATAEDMGTMTIKAGVPQAYVMGLQKNLNMCANATPALVADGKYGPKTTAAVKAFQMSTPGLTVDGKAGPMTKTALVAKCSGTTVSTSTIPGCSTGALFSSTTGQSCSGSTVFGSSSTEGLLTNVARTGAVNNAKVPEGSKDIQIMSVEVTAKDADQKIDGLTINITNGALRLTRGASEVSVWLNGTKIGSKMASEWSSDTSGYDYRFTGMNGVVAKDQKAILYVAISANPSFDISDVTGTWTTTLSTTGISAISPNGRYRDYGPTTAATTTFTFEKSGSTSSDVKYKVTTASSNPTAQNVQVSNTGDTADKTLLAFDVKAENGVMVLQRLPITLTAANGGADAVVPNVEAIVKSVKLYANGTLLSNETVPTGTGVKTITFGSTSKLNYTINSNATVKFEVRVDMNDIENTGAIATDFDNGDTIVAAYTDVAYGGSTIVELPMDGNYIQNRSGSSTGELQTLRSTGVQVTMGSATSDTPITTTGGEILSRTIHIPVTVQAFEDTAYIARTVENASTPSGTQAFAFRFEDAAGSVKTITNSATISSTNATIEGSAYRIDAGTSKTFDIAITMTGTTSHAIKQYRVQLEAVQNYTDSALTAGANVQVLTPTNAFETDRKSVV